MKPRYGLLAKGAFAALFLSAALAAIPQSARSQEVTAAVTGTVTDQSGAAVVSGTVTAKDVDRGTIWTAQTNTAGVYDLPRLPVGTYEVRAEAKGFQTAVHPPITLVLNQTARLEFQLKVGNMSETVTVTSEPPLLQTERTELGTIIDANTNDALPLPTRNYIQLTLLSPGAVHPDPNSMKGDDNPNIAGGRPFINGNREQANNFLLDGLDNNQVSDNLVGYSPSVDAIQEFNLITQNGPAEFGQYQGGVVNVSLKSGTNSFHGDAFEFFRNDKLNANSWANNLSGSPKNKLRYNMFGGTFGGPIQKDKLFFFADFQGQRFNHPQNTSKFSLFTMAERGGDFGAICSSGFDATGVCKDRDASGNIINQLYNPFNVNAVTLQRQPVPFNNFANTSDTIDVVANNLFTSSLYPQPVNNNLTENFFDSSGDQLHTNQGDLKMDYNISQKDHLFGRYSHMYQTNPGFNSFALFGSSTVEAPAQSLVLGWSHVFNSNIVNDLRVGASYIKDYTVNNSTAPLGNLGTQLGIANANDNGPGLLGIAFNGGFASGIGSDEIIQRFADTVFQYGDTLVITRGRHIFHTGAEFKRYRVNSLYPGNNGFMGFMNFTGQWTQAVLPAGLGCTPPAGSTTCTVGGLPEADFWLGLPSLFGRGRGIGWGQRANYFGTYLQDDWRVTSNLTLNLGLRYEAQTPWVEVHDRQDNFGLFSGTLIFANEASSRALYRGYYSGYSFQPRLGFAWTPGILDRKFVVRGAYTVSSYLEGTGTNLRLPENAPFNTEFENPIPPYSSTGSNLPPSRTENGLLPPPPPSVATCGPPNFTCFVSANIRLWDQNYWPAFVQQWNLSVQQQFWHNTTLQIGYVGQRGTHLANPMWLNQAMNPVFNPATGTITTTPGPFIAGNPTLKNEVSSVRGTMSNANQWYNALQTVLQKRYGAGLEYQVAYTYSKCTTNSAGYFGTWGAATQTSPGIPYWQNIYDPKAEWGPCFFDETHNLTSYAVYDIPLGHNRKYGKDLNPLVNAVVGNWNLSGILSLHSGFALTISSWNDPSGTGAFATRLNCSSHPRVLDQPLPASVGPGIQWFDPSVFSAPSPATFGDCGNGIVRGPSLKNFDMSLMKEFPFSEARKFQFRADFINLTNTPILGAPSVFGPSGSLGQITSSQGERQIQFALKLYF